MGDDYFSKAAHADQFNALISALVSHVCDSCDLKVAKLQPIQITDIAKPRIAGMKAAIEQLFASVGCEDSATDFLIANVYGGTNSFWPAEAPAANKDTVVVGLLLAFKEVDAIAHGLLAGCRRLQQHNMAMEKFIGFMASEEEQESDQE